MEKFYKLSDIAKMLDVSVQTIRREIHRGNLKAGKTSDTENAPFRVSQSDLDEYLAGKQKGVIMQYIEREIKDVKESIEHIKDCIMESNETNDILFYAKMLEKYQDILKYWEGRKNVQNVISK